MYICDMTCLFHTYGFQQRMLMMILIFCILQFYIVENLCAQQLTWENFVEKISTDDELENSDWEMWLEDLSELHEHPFNLNTATKEELEQLPFLDDKAVEEILAYVYRYGPMQTLGELVLIEALSYDDRQYLPLFVYVEVPERKTEKISLKNLLKHGRNELITSLDIPLYQRDGYKSYTYEELLKNPNKVYLGNALHHTLRYRYQYRDRLYWGLTMEKDAGEPFGSYGNWSYDAFSFHLLLKSVGKLKTLALGDYRIGFGQGLVVNTDFSLGKIALLNSMDRSRQIRKFSSASETGFFRGAAAAFQFGPVCLSAFYSYCPQDATLNEDGTISSLKTDGLHRTQLECSKKHNTVTQTVGGEVRWENKYLKLGVVGLYQHYNRQFSTGTAVYRQYYPQGMDFVNASLHYQVNYARFLFAGETAYSQTYGGWATLNRVTYRLNAKCRFVGLQRLYSYRYVGLVASSFEEGGRIANESGFYLGAECMPWNVLKLSVYADYFYFPWPKFGISTASDGVEGLVQADWQCHPAWNLTGRYQIKKKTRYDEPYWYHKLKTQLQYRPDESWLLRLMARYTRVRDRYGRVVGGHLVGLTSNWQHRSDKFRLSCSAAYFNSQDYKAVMSFYESGLLYSFSFLNFYGRGYRCALNCRWDITPRWMVMCKYGLTGYTDRDEIGSGPQRIDGPLQNDLSFQLRFKF